MTWNNQPGPSHSEGGTQEFPPVSGRPPTQPRSNRAVPWLLLVIILLLVTIVIGALGWSQGWFNDRGSELRGESTQSLTSTVVVTEIPEPADAPPAPPAVATEPAAAPVLPPAAIAVEGAPGSGQIVRAFTEVHRGNDNTSEAFARNVGVAFRSNFSATGQTSPELNVYSPVTDLYYSMSCQDNGTFVTCTGGNNAVVYLL